MNRQCSHSLWLRLGPGAIIASLTIGSGELIFSTRAGALFGPKIVWFFCLVCLLKWVLLYTTGRQIILRGIHPMESWTRLPGPRGWLPMSFLLLGIPCFPIWVAFHANTTASLLPGGFVMGWQTGMLWPYLLLLLCAVLSIAGQYKWLEKIQLLLVSLLLGIAMVALFLVSPQFMDWGRLAIPWGDWVYPEWIESYPSFTQRPVWVELSTYVGIIGGSSYDYLCYVSFLREKGWGRAGFDAWETSPRGAVSRAKVSSQVSASDMADAMTSLRWDTCMSFLSVFFFSVVFVILGHEILAPMGQVPVDGQLLSMQAYFVSDQWPVMRKIFQVGAFAAMLGTLYVTLEVGPRIFVEAARAMGWQRWTAKPHQSHKKWVLAIAVESMLVVASTQWAADSGKTFSFIWLLTPANLFTGVFGCGVVLWATLWMAFRPPEGMSGFLARFWKWLMAPAGLIFLLLGIKGYLDFGGGGALLILAGSFGLGMAWARWVNQRRGFL